MSVKILEMDFSSKVTYVTGFREYLGSIVPNLMVKMCGKSNGLHLIQTSFFYFSPEHSGT